MKNLKLILLAVVCVVLTACSEGELETTQDPDMITTAVTTTAIYETTTDSVTTTQPETTTAEAVPQATIEIEATTTVSQTTAMAEVIVPPPTEPPVVVTQPPPPVAPTPVGYDRPCCVCGKRTCLGTNCVYCCEGGDCTEIVNHGNDIFMSQCRTRPCTHFRCWIENNCRGGINCPHWSCRHCLKKNCVSIDGGTICPAKPDNAVTGCGGCGQARDKCPNNSNCCRSCGDDCAKNKNMGCPGYRCKGCDARDCSGCCGVCRQTVCHGCCTWCDEKSCNGNPDDGSNMNGIRKNCCPRRCGRFGCWGSQGCPLWRCHCGRANCYGTPTM